MRTAVPDSFWRTLKYLAALAPAAAACLALDLYVFAFWRVLLSL